MTIDLLNQNHAKVPVIAGHIFTRNSIITHIYNFTAFASMPHRFMDLVQVILFIYLVAIYYSYYYKHIHKKILLQPNENL